MNTLKNHVILYDSECPMCKVYTHAFTSTGMLDTEGRAAYQDMPAFACPLVDRERAVNEIALIDKTTGEVRYGIESLFTVIGHSFPCFRPLFSFKPFLWLMRKVYAFISYNRKVIIPAPKAASTSNPALQPAFRLHYRIAWLIFTVFIAGSILTAYARLLTPLIPAGNAYREYAICIGQILFQGAMVSGFAPSKTLLSVLGTNRLRQLVWDYLGNMMTISLAGAFLLLPFIPAASFLHLSSPAGHAHLTPVLAAAWFLIVTGTMLLEHIRRTRLLSLGWIPTATWVLYRLILLFLISVKR